MAIPYTATRTYQQFVATLEAEELNLKMELEQLAGIKRGSRSEKQKKRATSIRARMKTIGQNLAGAPTLASFTWAALCEMLAEAEGCVWSDVERALGEQELESYEGRYERSLCHRMGWPMGASLETHDFPDDGEGKYLGSKLETFRVGKAGKRAWGRVYRSIVREFREDAMTPEQWDLLSDGEVSRNKIYGSLPGLVKQLLQTSMAPDRVLDCYKTLYLMFDYGFIVLPRKDYAAAISLEAVTQMSPKYKLKREYVERRLLMTSSDSQNQPDVAA